jgi:hypothetical protein
MHHLHSPRLLTAAIILSRSLHFLFFVQITAFFTFAPRVDIYPTLSADDDIYSFSAYRATFYYDSVIFFFSSFYNTTENTFLDSFFHLTWLQWEGLYGRRTSLILFSLWLRSFFTLRPSRSFLLVDKVRIVFPTTERVSCCVYVRTSYALRFVWDSTKVPLLRIEEG